MVKLEEFNMSLIYFKLYTLSLCIGGKEAWQSAECIVGNSGNSGFETSNKLKYELIKCLIIFGPRILDLNINKLYNISPLYSRSLGIFHSFKAEHISTVLPDPV